VAGFAGSCEGEVKDAVETQEVRDSQEHGTSAKETAGKKQGQPKREAM
jgi:hypothetical protein